ncbi:hypothetical protein KAS08_00280 [Candidatus Pacearchaeota archaeon]|nr:hypothetical protein [Candidatus Pacearchaeota archaeon]
MLKKMDMPFGLPKLLPLPSMRIRERATGFKEKKREISQMKRDVDNLELPEKIRQVIEELLSTKKVMIRSYDGETLVQLISTLEFEPLFSGKFNYQISTTDKVNSQTKVKDFLIKITEKDDVFTVRKS